MEQFCQSCGMPLQEDVLGTNKDGSKNEEYCSYCYEQGAFKDHMNVKEMAALCAKFMKEEQPEIDIKQSEKENLAFLNTLKRWKSE